MKARTGSRGWLIWVSRVLILVVLAWNLDAAIMFMATPSAFLAGFELSGVPGKIAIAGTGLLFMMWQVPYFFALVNPKRFRISLGEALIMQFIGVVGESLLLQQVGEGFNALRASIMRFIVFDGIGVGLLAMALLLIIIEKRKVQVKDAENTD